MKDSLKNLPTPKSGDVLEAAEMVRSTLCLLRQAFGILFMCSGNPVLSKRFPHSESEIKEFCVQFDDVTKFLKDGYDCLINSYQFLKES